MTSGGQCVMTTGIPLMLQWSAISWDMHTLEVSVLLNMSLKPCLHILHVTICAGGRAYSDAHFGGGSGQVFLDDVQCSSSSNQLLECSSRPILSHNCFHTAGAGVGCEGMCCAREILV